MIKKKKIIPNQPSQTYPIFIENFRTQTDTKTKHLLIPLISDSIGPEALPESKKRKTDEQTTELDDEQQQRAGGREEKEIGEKQALAGGFKRPNAGVAVGGSSDGIGRQAPAAGGREGGRKRKMGKNKP